MFKHILVPLDLSDRNERILRLAVGLARIKHESGDAVARHSRYRRGVDAGTAQLLQETRAAVAAHARTSGHTIRRRRGHRPSRRCHRGSRPRDHQGGDGPTGDAHCDGLPSCDARTSWPRLGHHQLQGRDRLSVSDSPGEVNRGRRTQRPARPSGRRKRPSWRRCSTSSSTPTTCCPCLAGAVRELQGSDAETKRQQVTAEQDRLATELARLTEAAAAGGGVTLVEAVQAREAQPKSLREELAALDQLTQVGCQQPRNPNWPERHAIRVHGTGTGP